MHYSRSYQGIASRTATGGHRRLTLPNIVSQRAANTKKQMESSDSVVTFRRLCDSTSERWSSIPLSSFYGGPAVLLSRTWSAENALAAQKQVAQRSGTSVRIRLATALLASIGASIALTTPVPMLFAAPIVVASAVVVRRLKRAQAERSLISTEVPVMQQEFTDITELAVSLVTQLADAGDRPGSLEVRDEYLRFLKLELGIGQRDLDRVTHMERRNLEHFDPTALDLARDAVGVMDGLIGQSDEPMK